MDAEELDRVLKRRTRNFEDEVWPTNRVVTRREWFRAGYLGLVVGMAVGGVGGWWLGRSGAPVAKPTPPSEAQEEQDLLTWALERADEPVGKIDKVAGVFIEAVSTHPHESRLWIALWRYTEFFLENADSNVRDDVGVASSLRALWTRKTAVGARPTAPKLVDRLDQFLGR